MQHMQKPTSTRLISIADCLWLWNVVAVVVDSG